MPDVAVIKKEFEDHRDVLQRQIDAINVRQTEVMAYITNLEAANANLNQAIAVEQDPIKKTKYYGFIKSNVDTLLEAHSIYKEYENVKNKYFKNISEVILDKHKLIEIEIRRLDEKKDSLMSDDFNTLMKNVLVAFSRINTSNSPDGKNVVPLDSTYEL